VESLDTAELLAQLKGIHLPEAPVAPSLYPVYFSAVVCIFAVFAYLARNYKNKKHWHKDALHELEQIRKTSASNAIQQTATLLKRIALTHTTDKNILNMHGDPWLEYLDRFYQTNFFSEGSGRVFGSALYKPGTTPDKNLYADLQRLIKRRGRMQ